MKSWSVSVLDWLGFFLRVFGWVALSVLSLGYALGYDLDPLRWVFAGSLAVALLGEVLRLASRAGR